MADAGLSRRAPQCAGGRRARGLAGERRGGGSGGREPRGGGHAGVAGRGRRNSDRAAAFLVRALGVMCQSDAQEQKIVSLISVQAHAQTNIHWTYLGK